MCPIALKQTESVAASVQSTPSDPQASCAPQAPMVGQSLERFEDDSQDVRVPPPTPNTLSSQSVRSSEGLEAQVPLHSPDADALPAQLRGSQRHRDSDLLQFSQSPRSAKRQRRTPSVLLVPDTCARDTVPDTPSSLHGCMLRIPTSHVCGLPDSQEQEHVNLDRLFAHQSCSMELGSSRTVAAMLVNDEKLESEVINSMFCRPPAPNGLLASVALAGGAASPQAIPWRDDHDTHDPTACSSPDVKPMSRLAQRGLLIPSLLAQCSASPPDMRQGKCASPAGIQPLGLREFYVGDHTLGPLGAGFVKRHTRPSPIASPYSFRSPARLQSSPTLESCSLGSDMGPLEGGSKHLDTVRRLKSLKRPASEVWTAREETPVSPGPLEEGLGTLYRGLRPIGPIQHAVKAMSKRKKVRRAGLSRYLFPLLFTRGTQTKQHKAFLSSPAESPVVTHIAKLYML